MAKCKSAKSAESSPNKQREIVAMFDSIAQNYDIANRILSFGIDRKWRKEACEMALKLCKKDSLDILDVACGTGDMILCWLKACNSSGNSSLDKHSADLVNRHKARTASPLSLCRFTKSNESHTENPSVVLNAESSEMQNSQSNNRSNGGVASSRFYAERAKIGLERPLSEVLHKNDSNEYPRTNCDNALNSIRGIDPSNAMLKIAKEKLPPSVILQNGEAKDLRVTSQSVDILSIAYGLRNVVEIDLALAEFHRVLRTDGILVILEFSKKDNENIFDKIARFYTKRILPYLGGFISKNYAAYKYLPDSVDDFLSLEQIAAKLRALGFSIKVSKRYFCNVCSLIIAQKDLVK